MKPWVKPQYRPSPRGQWARTPDEAAEQWKGQVTTCAEPGACREKRAAAREPCWGIVPPTVDEVLDLILSAAKGKTPGEDGITAEVLGAGGRPMAQLLQTLFAGVGLQRALPIVWKGGTYHGNNGGVTLDDHVVKILGRWIRPKIFAD